GNLGGNPLSSILRMSRVGRVTRNHKDRLFLDLLCSFHFRCNSRQKIIRLRFDWLQSVRQKNRKPFLVVQGMSLLTEILRKLEVRDGIRGDQVFETEEILQKVLAHDKVSSSRE